MSKHFNTAMKAFPMAFPLHATVAYGMGVKEVDWSQDGKGFVAGVDYRRIYLDGKAIERYVHNDHGAMFIVLHEVEHVIRFHNVRRGDRDPELWNIACDFVINQSLLDSGLSPKGFRFVTIDEFFSGERPKRGEHELVGLADTRVRGMSEEEVYDLIKSKVDEMPMPCLGEASFDMHGDPSNGDGDGSADGENGDGRGATQRALVKQHAVVKAAVEAAKRSGRGTIPAGLEEILRALEPEPVVDWRKKFARFFNHGATNEDWDTSRPHHVMLAAGSPVMFPEIMKYGIDHVMFAIDTSGSMGIEELRRAFSEAMGMVRTGKPQRVTIVECDAKIQAVHRMTLQEAMAWEPGRVHGRGGTAFTPIVRMAKDERPDMLIVFTDGWGDNPDPIDVPTVWLTTTGECSARWGEIINVSEA